MLLGVGVSACGGDGAASTAEVMMRPVGNEMRFEVTTFTVKAGQTVHLSFENTATSQAMQHNVVVLENADAVDRVGQAAVLAQDNGYIPDDAAILAHTPLSMPGETVEVTFTAPATPGEYPYICTFPGHYVLMRGTMVVEPA
jgi:azurin